jgi:hypothetical protein
MDHHHLDVIERTITHGEQLINEQQGRIAKLANEGHDTTDARQLLTDFLFIQAKRLERRENILQEIGQAEKAAANRALRRPV